MDMLLTMLLSWTLGIGGRLQLEPLTRNNGYSLAAPNPTTYYGRNGEG